MPGSDQIKPIPFWQSLLIFGIPGIAIYLATHFLVPWLIATGISLVHAWTLAVVGPTILNAFVVLTIYYLDERPGWRQFVARFRLGRPRLRSILIVPVVAVLVLFLNELLAWTVPVLSQVPLFAPQPVIPEIFSDVYESLDQVSSSSTFMGEQVGPQDLWLVFYWIFFWVFLAVTGEELVWRGYVLPRQQLVYGNKAWLVNGILWNIPFHLYTAHNLVSDLPLYLLLPLLVQKTGNTWTGILLHALLVSLALILVIPGLVLHQ